MVDSFDDDNRRLYLDVLLALSDSSTPFMFGGAFAVYYYTGWWRDTHDIDIYVTPDIVERVARVLSSAGFENVGEQAEGDREWIYHARQGDIFVDVIWRFANLVDYVTPEWFSRAAKGMFLGVETRFVPVEELVWVKLFVINRHRCDWPDVMRIIRAQCSRIDWQRLLGLLGEHWLLLAGLVDVFDWQHPDSTDCVPTQIRDELAKRRLECKGDPTVTNREQLLDPWIHHRTDKYVAWRNE